MGTLTWTDSSGKKQTRETNHTINIKNFKGTPGYPLLLMAANRHLSIRVLEMWLEDIGGKNVRGRNWIYKRRWLFEDPDKVKPVVNPHPDGQDARAITIMQENPALSLRDLSRVLSERGIKRGKDWVRRHRYG